MFGAPTWLYAAIGGAVALAGAYFYIDHRARVDERNAAAAKQLEQIEQDRKDREKNDAKAGGLDDPAALKCLRSPTGC